MLDLKALADTTASIVQLHVGKAVAPLLMRIEELEARQPEKGEKGEPGEAGAPGRDIDMDAVAEMIRSAVADAVAALPPAAAGPPGEAGADGKGADPEDVKRMVEEAVSAIPAPRDGADGKDGEPIDPEVIKAMVGEQVAKAISEIPVPRDGADGKDGASLVEAHIDREGALLLTLSDGRVKNVGPICGKDGRDGVDGQNGERGPSGFSLTDFDASLADDGRTIILSFEQGDTREEYELGVPAMIYRGVWKEGSYTAGDAVTWGGSVWVAEKDTDAKPDDPAGGFKLAVKRGRDGKDGGR